MPTSFSSFSSLPHLSLSSPPPTFPLCLTTYWKYQYQIAVPRCGCSFAEGLRSLSELMSHMCGGSGPHQSRRRLGGRSVFGGLRGHRELVIRAPAESTGLTSARQNKARLVCPRNTHTHTHSHTHTHIPTVRLLMQRDASVRVCFPFSKRAWRIV